MKKLPVPLWILFGPVALILLFTALLPLLSPMGQRPPDDAWNGPFYSNPNDSALLVPKRHGIGYTLNFGNRWAWPVLGFILLMAAIPLLVTAISIHNSSGLGWHK